MAFILRAVCWSLSAYFLVVAHLQCDLPLVVTPESSFLIILSIVLFLIPFAQSVSFGSLFKYESKIEEVKKDVREFKDEFRQTLLVQSTLLQNVSQNVSQHTIVNLPPLSEARQAEQALDEHSGNGMNRLEINNEIQEFIVQGRDDPNLALAKLRMELEIQLRRILGKTLESSKKPIKFMSTRSLWTEYIKMDPSKAYLVDGFNFVNGVANAAIHGQRISKPHAEEAFTVGVRILDDLQNVPEL